LKFFDAQVVTRRGRMAIAMSLAERQRSTRDGR
jgi:hypothetical protein